MKFKTILTFLIVLALAKLAGAQTKISGTAQCSKPDPMHALEVGDRPNHSYVVFQGKCTWSKPLEIAGSQSQDHLGTVFQEVSGNRATVRGSGIDTMANGDKFYVRWQGAATLKDGVPESDEGKWSFAGGTGKLKAIKGKGTYKGKGAPDGTATYEVEGDYELPK